MWVKRGFLYRKKEMWESNDSSHKWGKCESQTMTFKQGKYESQTAPVKNELNAGVDF